MKTLKLRNLILIGVLLLTSFATAQAQRMQDRPPKEFRPQQILRELNLSREQIQQIRRIHEDKREQMDAAQMRLREANRSLDKAIYADNVNEEEIQTRLKEVQLAQADVIKIRNLTELAVRKVLTAEQLSKFRELREQAIKRMEEQRMDDDNPPQERDDMSNPPLNNRPFQQRPKNRVN
jgi:Spy/CpxP family protein refolding chaperone